MPWEDWHEAAKELSDSSISGVSLTGKEIDKALTIGSLSYIIFLCVLVILWYFVFPHLGAVATFIAFFSQSPVLAGGANIITYLTFLAAIPGCLIALRTHVKKHKKGIDK